MSEGQGFLAGESGRLLEANDDDDASLWLSTPPGDQRGPLPAPTDNVWAVAFKINVAIAVVSVSVDDPRHILNSLKRRTTLHSSRD